MRTEQVLGVAPPRRGCEVSGQIEPGEHARGFLGGDSEDHRDHLVASQVNGEPAVGADFHVGNGGAVHDVAADAQKVAHVSVQGDRALEAVLEVPEAGAQQWDLLEEFAGLGEIAVFPGEIGTDGSSVEGAGQLVEAGGMGLSGFGGAGERGLDRPGFSDERARIIVRHTASVAPLPDERTEEFPYEMTGECAGEDCRVAFYDDGRTTEVEAATGYCSDCLESEWVRRAREAKQMQARLDAIGALHISDEPGVSRLTAYTMAFLKATRLARGLDPLPVTRVMEREAA